MAAKETREAGNVHVADKTAQTIFIDADPATVMDVIADIDSYPEWIKEYKEAEVLDTDGEPDLADIAIPGNDDSMRSIDVVIRGGCCPVRCSRRSMVNPDWRPTVLEPMSPTSCRLT